MSSELSLKTRLAHIYRSVWFQIWVVGIVSFSQPGIWNALNGLGAGGEEKPFLVNAANAATYGIMSFGCCLAGSLANYIGVKWTLVLGVIFYTPYASSLYCNNRFGIEWYVVFGAVLCGIGASFFWASEATIAVGYPSPKERGKMVGVWLGLRNFGPVIAGAIEISLNYKSNKPGKVGYSTYLALIGIQCIGLPVALLLSPPEKVRRSDGTRIPHLKARSVYVELGELRKTLLSRRMLLLFPIFVWGTWGGVYQGNYLTKYFSVRSRTLASFLGAVLGIFADMGVGRLLDLKYFNTRQRAQYWWFILAVCTTALWVWQLINQVHFLRHPSTVDWADGPVFGNAFAPLMLFKFFSESQNCFLYWLVGTFSHEDGELERAVGVLRTFESVGSTFSYVVGATHWANLNQGILASAVWLLCIIPTTLVLRTVPTQEPVVKLHEDGKETPIEDASSVADEKDHKDLGVEVGDLRAPWTVGCHGQDCRHIERGHVDRWSCRSVAPVPGSLGCWAKTIRGSFNENPVVHGPAKQHHLTGISATNTFKRPGPLKIKTSCIRSYLPGASQNLYAATTITVASRIRNPKLDTMANSASCSTPNALEVPELVALILSFMKRRQLTSAVRVCKLWGEISLDLIWADLPSVLPLLELLNPLGFIRPDHERPQFGYWRFTEDLTAAHWQRFRRFSSRVKALHYDDGDDWRGEESSSIDADDLTTMSLVGPLCPRLHTLSWTLSESPSKDAMALLPFIQPNLKRLSVSLPFDQCVEISAVRKFFSGLAATPGVLLEGFAFKARDFGANPVHVNDSVNAFIRSQPNLKYLRTPTTTVSELLVDPPELWKSSLETLVLEICNDGVLWSIMDPVLQLRNLKTLILPRWWWNQSSISLHDLEVMGSSWSLLEYLDGENVYVTLDVLEAMPRLLPRLVRLAFQLKVPRDTLPLNLTSQTARFKDLVEINLGDITKWFDSGGIGLMEIIGAQELVDAIASICPPGITVAAYSIIDDDDDEDDDGDIGWTTWKEMENALISLGFNTLNAAMKIPDIA